MKKIKKNRDILIEYFWEHVQFGWSSQQYMVNRGMGFRGYRDLVSKMTRKSIGMMANLLERSRVQALLEEKYGADLIPSEKDLGFPTNPGVDDATRTAKVNARIRHAATATCLTRRDAVILARTRGTSCLA